MNTAEEFKSQNQFDLAANCSKLITALNNIVFRARNMNLERADLKGLNLAGINLKKSNLSYADFSGSNLENANFEEANIDYTNFTLATIKGISFKKAYGHIQVQEAILSPDEEPLEYDGTPEHLVSIYEESTNTKYKEVLAQILVLDLEYYGLLFRHLPIDIVNDFIKIARHFNVYYDFNLSPSTSLINNIRELTNFISTIKIQNERDLRDKQESISLIEALINKIKNI